MRRIIFTLTLILFLLPGLCLADDLTRETQTLLLKARDTVTHAERELSKKRSLSTDFNSLKSLAEELRVNRLLLQDRFQTRQQTVNTLGPKAIDRHNAMLQEYNRVIEQLLTIFDAAATEKVLTSDTIKKLKTLLENIAPKRPNPIYGSLPYRHLNYALKAPLSGTTIIPAYLGGDKTVKDEDLADTALAPISKTITEKAQELQWNPVLIYEWVKNNVESEWYWGVQKGAEETLRQKSGNDADQACLLVALLRASGYPSRYMRGTMETFPNWQRFKVLTGIQSEQDLLAFFHKAGIPAKSVIAGGKISNIQIEHIWVESQIPYANYRGVVIDTHGKTWLGLDTHIKTKDYEVKPAKPWPETLDIRNIRDQYLSQVQTQTPLEFLQNYINTWLGLNQPGTTYQDLLETRTIIPDILKILPAGMQITPIAIIHEYEDLPDELIHQVRLKARDQTDNIFFDATLPAWKLSNQKVTLTYEPETIEDQEIINSYDGLDNTPAYLVRLRPVLKVNNERTVISQAGLPMGSDYTLEISLISSSGTESVTNTHIIGDLTVIGIVSQQAISPQELPQEEQDAEYLLHKEVLNYIKSWDQAEEELTSLFRLALVRPIPTLVTLGGVIQVDYLLDQPHEFTFKGIYVDADLRAVELVPRPSPLVPNPSSPTPKLFLQLSSLEGSILESKVIEDDFQVECISTAKLFGLINSRPANLQPVNIDRTNITVILPTLSLAQNIKDAVTNAVNQGFLVRVPQSELAYEDWTGTGYLMERPSTGEAGYMLSGMIAGGMSVWGMTRWNQTLADILQYTYVEPPNKDPTSAYYIQKIGATDLQSATVKEKLPKTLQVIVKDKDRKPVPNATVTFIVKAGGGKLYDRNGQEVDSLSGVTTNAKGIAEAVFRVGHYTGKNPTFMKLYEKDTYVSQVGENIIDAALSSGTKVLIPFTAYGIPGEPDHMTKYYGDNINGHILQMIGFVSVMVEDQYYNPLSNKIVTFTAKDIAEPKCVAPGEQRLSAMLVQSGHACMLPLPSYDACKCSGSPCESGGKTLERKTIRGGAAAQVFLGAVPEATYEIEAVCGALRQTFHVHSNSYGNCGPNAEPFHVLKVHWMPWVGLGGALVHAYNPGQIATLTARMWVINEEAAEELGSETLNCDPPPPLTCNNKVIGSKKYSEITNLESARITFGGNPGKSIGGGLYEGLYTVKPGLNKVELKGNVTMKVRKTTMECPSTCRLDNAYPLELQDSRIMQFYGVTVKMDPQPGLMVDGSGYLMADTLIGFTVEPEDYPVGTAYAILYEEGREYSALASVMIYGTGFVYLSQGFKFDPSKNYEVQVILNRGSHVEISGPKEKLKFGKIYIQDKTPGFEDSLLKPFDYYPLLETKTIVVRGELAGGVPMDSGSVRAEVVYPYPGWAIYQKIHVLQPEADMRAGRAEFKLQTDQDVTPQDLESIEIKFTYLVNENDNGSVSGAWKVRNNSNVTMQEVLAGEAVFVFDNSVELNHKGVTAANVPDNDYANMYFDFVQVLLNQVVPRKRSLGNVYTLLDENGIFSRDLEKPENNTLQAIYFLKDHFHIDNTSNAQWDFSKLMKDYNIPEADYLAWDSKIVDKRLLVGAEQRTTDNLVNPSVTQGDTGLYELYVNVVKRFAAAMIELEEYYAGERGTAGVSAPTLNWYARTGEGPAVHGNGMSYCFGCKNDIGQYNTDVVNCVTPGGSAKSGVTLYYVNNKGNVVAFTDDLIDLNTPNAVQVNNAYQGNINENGCTLTGNKNYPGLYYHEYYSWNYGGGNFYRNRNAVTGQLTNPWPAFPQFNVSFWAGTDCSGLAQRGVHGGRVAVQGVMDIAIPSPGNPWVGSQGFFENDDYVYPLNIPTGNSQPATVERNRILKLFKKGDLLRYPGHVATVYSERWGQSIKGADYDIIHAFGSRSYFDRTLNQSIFSRKVMITGNDLPQQGGGILQPSGFGRIKFWN